jgi:hypothetical protein
MRARTQAALSPWFATIDVALFGDNHVGMAGRFETPSGTQLVFCRPDCQRHSPFQLTSSLHLQYYQYSLIQYAEHSTEVAPS